MEKIDLFSKYANIELGNFSLSMGDNVPQSFTHRFVDGRIYTIYIKYNRMFDQWLMDVYLQDNGEEQPEALNIALNSCLDLFSSLKYKNLGEFYVFPKTFDSELSPIYNTLNLNFIYYWRHD